MNKTAAAIQDDKAKFAVEAAVSEVMVFLNAKMKREGMVGELDPILRGAIRLGFKRGVEWARRDNNRQEVQPNSCAHVWRYYSGCLGYESEICVKCGLDYNDKKEGGR